MDFSKLITRTQYEKVACSLGYCKVHLLSFAELENIAAEFNRQQSELYKRANTSALPHSYVLAEVFNLEAHSLEVPEHLLENEPGVEWVTCPRCDGEKHVFSVWGSYEYADERLTRCLRCWGDGEVLDYVEVQPIEEAYPAHVQLKEAA